MTHPLSSGLSLGLALLTIAGCSSNGSTNAPVDGSVLGYYDATRALEGSTAADAPGAATDAGADAGLVDGGLADAGLDADEGGAETGAGGLVLHGTVSANIDQLPAAMPIPNRGVTVLDAKGTVRMVTTDSSGAFVVPGVVAPYLVTVAGSPSLAPWGTYSFVGVSTDHPNLQAAPVAIPTRRTATFVPSLPTMCTPQAGCSIYFSLSSPSQATQNPLWTPPQALPYYWYSGLASAPIAVTIHMLVAQGGQYWHWSEVTSVTAGAQITLPTTTPTLITAMTGPVSVQTVMVDAAGWTPASVSFFLNYPGNEGSVFAQYVPSTSMFPALPNTTWSATAFARPNPSSVGNASAFSPSLPFSTPSTTLTVYGCPKWLAPTDGATVSVMRDSLSWQPHDAQGLDMVQFSAPTAGSVPHWSMTYLSGNSLSLSELIKSGVTIEPALYTVRFWEGRPFSSFDAFVEQGPLTLISPNYFAPNELPQGSFQELKFTTTP